MLGVMHAHSLSHAIELQNAVAYGLTAGLYTQNPDDLALWLDRVRPATSTSTAASPARSCSASRSAAGSARRSAPARRPAGRTTSSGSALAAHRRRAASSTLHLRGLDSRIAALIEAAQPSLDFAAFDWLRRGALSDAVAWDREFGRVRDVSGLGVERNLFRYRPVPAVALRATADATWQALLRVVVAGRPRRVGVHAERPGRAARRGAPGAGRARDAASPSRPTSSGSSGCRRAPPPAAAGAAHRLARDSVAALHTALAAAVDGDPDLAVYANEVTTAGRLELLPFLHEQSITITAHRFGNPDPWSESVI